MSAPSFLVNDEGYKSDSGWSSLEAPTYDYDGDGDLEVWDDGRFKYTPPSGNFVGIDTFTYEACDKNDKNQCDEGLVTIQVMGDSENPNQPNWPVPQSDYYTGKQIHYSDRLIESQFI